MVAIYIDFVNLQLVSKTFQIWYLTTCSFNRQVAIPVNMAVVGIVTLLVIMAILVIMATVVIGPKPLHLR